MSEPSKPEELINQFTDSLIRALDEQAAADKQRKKKELSPFFVSRLWFFLAVFSVIVNILLAGILFWQHMRIDYLIK
jgi:hypothetical protein